MTKKSHLLLLLTAILYLNTPVLAMSCKDFSAKSGTVSTRVTPSPKILRILEAKNFDGARVMDYLSRKKS